MRSASDLSAYTSAPALVIDDDTSSCYILTDFLTELGFKTITTAKSGGEAIEFLNKNPDWRGIILCDWNMPQMTGAELYAYVKKSNPNVPFIMVTGRNDEDSIIHAKDSGIYAYILKPFSLEELERKVSKVSANHSDFLKAPIQSDKGNAAYSI